MAESTMCLLCMCEYPSTFGELIGVHTARGSELEVARIISKHFPLQVTENSPDRVCGRCWKTVSEFHALHDFVSQAQSSLQETKALLMEDDPLTQCNFIETTKLGAEDEVRPQDQPELGCGRNFFYPEVKIEEHELDHLPRIEILEATANTQPAQEESTTTATRRLRKRVKAEDEAFIDNEDGAAEPALAEPKKRRGRPRKVDNPIESTAKPEEDVSLNLKSEEEESEFIDEDPDFSCNIDEGLATSDHSFEDNSEGSDEDTDSDFELGNKDKLEFAVVPKRTVVRPKKYKKRTKPTEPKVRMSRELLEQRKKQQEEYDIIIGKFFNSVLACPICNLSVHNFTDMQRHHRLTHQVDPGYVMCCGRKFSQRKVLAEHVQVHWNPEHFKCSICEKSFQNSRHLESHQQVHLDPAIKLTFQCDLCSKVFLSKTAIDYHKLNKHVPKSEFKFTCSDCNKKFLTERKLKNHMNSMHDPESTIICDKCGKQMRTKIILKKHQELMHSDKPRPEPELKQCQICGAWLKGMTGLKQHMKSIHVESAGEHRCHICSKVSPNARALRRHIYHNHECERKFKCTMCEKAFKRPQELKEHTSTHTGEVLYTCPNCPMTFFCSANMYKHRQRLHRAQYEADKNQPKPPNILKISRNASSQSKPKQEI
ncbi:zinc finger and SCAN domain-containing protein 12 [Drosophila obscura]|uniref:zinc finger and SCAN domain-containing protein 12 n=1 Tax=Drosophila obscura TaxID=7282 RepID=UPI001BB1A37D|nr:zinc finger and SCAN domain-containing protein 12 [Drosophila obscura]